VPWVVFGAALLSAVTHGLWNVIAKRHEVPSDALYGIIVATAAICTGALPFVGLPPSDAWPWIVAAALCNVAYTSLLGSVYRNLRFAVAYPLIRAAVPPTIVLLGWITLQPAFGGAAMAGVATVMASLLLLGGPAVAMQSDERRGVMLALLSGMVLAGSMLLDAHGARVAGGGVADFAAYCVATSLTTALALTAVRGLTASSPFRVLWARPAVCVPGALFLLVSVSSGIWAYSQGPIALVACVRESSILLGGILGVLVLREDIGRLQWAAIGVAVCGTVLIQLG
jgi:drug/metabolite transporter (DMT)-like permease